jgi:ABC-type lipoprotein release transport system permease subunit
MLLENVRKATSGIVTVVVSVKIRSWTALNQEGIQHFRPECSIINFIVIIIIIIVILLSLLLFRRSFC